MNIHIHTHHTCLHICELFRCSDTWRREQKREKEEVDGLCPGSERRDTSTSPSSCLLTVHNEDDDVTPPLSLQNAALVAAVAAKPVMALIVALPMLVCTMTHRVTMITTNRQMSSKQSLAMWIGATTQATMMMGKMSV